MVSAALIARFCASLLDQSPIVHWGKLCIIAAHIARRSWQACAVFQEAQLLDGLSTGISYQEQRGRHFNNKFEHAVSSSAVAKYLFLQSSDSTIPVSKPSML